MHTFRVLVHHGCTAPSLHLVTAADEATAELIANDLLAEAQDAVGVEVWQGEERIYVRGATPLTRTAPAATCTAAVSQAARKQVH